MRHVTASLLIGGERVDGARRTPVFNPAEPSDEVGSTVAATVADVERAFDAARTAQGPWSRLSFSRRAQLIGLALDGASQDLDARAEVFVRENGKTLAEATREIRDMASRAKLTLDLAGELDAAQRLPSQNGYTEVRWRPYGVVVSIVPWNAPVSLAFLQIVPALLAGNAVVVKAPETCPLALLETIERVAQTLPPGLLNAVTGPSSAIGEALTTHPAVGKIGFTGGVHAARKILCGAAQGITSVSSELGGNDPAILMRDVSLDERTMGQMAGIVFRMTGQVCMAIKRIYVHTSRHDEFVERFGVAMDRIVVGNGLRDGVTMGPLHTRAALDRAHGYLDEARASGARVAEFGQVLDAHEFDKGHFMRPTLVTGVDATARLVSEEQFCAAIPVIAYDDVEDALGQANDSPFGLGGSVWGQDLEAAAALAWRVQSGTVFVNTHGTNAVNRHAPYGGLKQSGTGRRAGLLGVQEYLQTQTLTVVPQ